MHEIKPYVIFISKHHPNRRFALDRRYTLIKEDWITVHDLKNIVQIEYFKGYPYLSKPEWLTEDETEELIALWTNYYD